MHSHSHGGSPWRVRSPYPRLAADVPLLCFQLAVTRSAFLPRGTKRHNHRVATRGLESQSHRPVSVNQSLLSVNHPKSVSRHSPQPYVVPKPEVCSTCDWLRRPCSLVESISNGLTPRQYTYSINIVLQSFKTEFLFLQHNRSTKPIM